jgi:hypothetical protein
MALSGDGIEVLRRRLVQRRLGGEEGFSWRGEDVLRIEGLADAVFGFALTLLVVSLEVPNTFDELLATMRGFFAFAISGWLLYTVWFDHYMFFRRYGLQDNVTLHLSSVLLFVVLFCQEYRPLLYGMEKESSWLRRLAGRSRENLRFPGECRVPEYLRLKTWLLTL